MGSRGPSGLAGAKGEQVQYCTKFQNDECSKFVEEIFLFNYVFNLAKMHDQKEKDSSEKLKMW